MKTVVLGTTQLAAIVGHPVAQVKLPGILNHYFHDKRLDFAMVPFDVPPAALADFFSVLRQGANLLGCVVTVPHKQAAAGFLDVLSERACVLSAVNVVRREVDGRLHGDHVDGFSFLSAARAHGFHPSGCSAVVVGSGGTGSAIAYALCATHAAKLCLLGRNGPRIQALGTQLQALFPSVQVTYVCRDLADVDLLAQATTLGMRASDAKPVAPELLATLTPRVLVADVITAPSITPLIELARARGCRTQIGVEMARASMPFLGGYLGVMPSVDPLAAVLAPLPPLPDKSKPPQ